MLVRPARTGEIPALDKLGATPVAVLGEIAGSLRDEDISFRDQLPELGALRESGDDVVRRRLDRLLEVTLDRPVEVLAVIAGLTHLGDGVSHVDQLAVIQ